MRLEVSAIKRESLRALGEAALIPRCYRVPPRGSVTEQRPR
ncbi:MAG: hypothetical protein R3B96_13655 [Pirellulaceae bacterium]